MEKIRTTRKTGKVRQHFPVINSNANNISQQMDNIIAKR